MFVFVTFIRCSLSSGGKLVLCSGYRAQPPEEALVEPFHTNSVSWDWKTVRSEVCVDYRYIVHV